MVSLVQLRRKQFQRKTTSMRVLSSSANDSVNGADEVDYSMGDCSDELSCTDNSTESTMESPLSRPRSILRSPSKRVLGGQSPAKRHSMQGSVPPSPHTPSPNVDVDVDVSKDQSLRGQRGGLLSRGRSFRFKKPTLLRAFSSRCVAAEPTTEDGNSSTLGKKKVSVNSFRSASGRSFPIVPYLASELSVDKTCNGTTENKPSLRSSLRRDHSLRELGLQAEQTFNQILAACHDDESDDDGEEEENEDPSTLLPSSFALRRASLSAGRRSLMSRQHSIQEIGTVAVNCYDQLLEDLDEEEAV